MIMKNLDVGVLVAVGFGAFVFGLFLASISCNNVYETDRQLLVECVEQSNNAGLCFDLLR